MNEKLEEIGETDSDEQIMIFTDDPVLKELGAQINGLLADRQRVRADFRRAEISSKKMLSNISHDIKTPLTVILGYLEIMRLARGDDEMLLKVEDKAKTGHGSDRPVFYIGETGGRGYGYRPRQDRYL